MVKGTRTNQRKKIQWAKRETRDKEAKWLPTARSSSQRGRIPNNMNPKHEYLEKGVENTL